MPGTPQRRTPGWGAGARAAAVACLVILSASCTSSNTSNARSSATDVGSVVSAGPSDASVGSSAPAVESSTTAETAPAPSSITVVGSAVGGNAGGEGEGSTNRFSEVVREADGSCRGWEGPGDKPWTEGLVEGATVTYLARETDEVLGTGTLGPGRAVAVDTNGVERWMCSFDFTAELTGNPETFRIQVGALEPWVARPDASRDGEFVASVNTEASFKLFSECTDPEFGATVFDFNVVGQYWSEGIPSVCFAGLQVVGIERPCRPAAIASDHIIAVTAADDPDVVYEDESGLQVDLATLTPGTPAIVVVATGRPC